MAGSNPDLLATLGWLSEAGADEAVGEMPVDRFAASESRRAQPAGPSLAAPKEQGEPNPQHALGSATAATILSRMLPGETIAKPVIGLGSDATGRAGEIAAACNSLPELQNALEAFDGCTLKRFATKTVFSDGTPRCRIMLIGESPGKEEDLAGLPFVGRAGKLLDKMLAAIRLDRKTNVYITNVLNWKPPANRDPSPEEAASSLPFLRRHIELVSPRIIVLLGAVPTRHVMGRSDGIMRLRGKWLEYYVDGCMVPVMPMLHPAYLLRRSIDKRLAWRDLQEVSTKVNLLGLLEETSARA